MVQENVVIVIDLSNYKSSYGEQVPFKAKIVEQFEFETVVRSLLTGKEYELYANQILEGLDITQIKSLLDMTKYGNSNK